MCHLKLVPTNLNNDNNNTVVKGLQCSYKLLVNKSPLTAMSTEQLSCSRHHCSLLCCVNASTVCVQRAGVVDSSITEHFDAHVPEIYCDDKLSQ